MAGLCKRLNNVSRAQKISTVVDRVNFVHYVFVSRAQKISTVVDEANLKAVTTFHALKKFLLL